MGKQILPINNKIELNLKEFEPASDEQKLLWEKEHLGFFVSEHPLQQYQEIIKKYLIPINKLDIRQKNKSPLKIIGLITSIKKINTYKNETMAFVKIEDSFGEIEVIVFPKMYKETNGLIWEENKMVCVTGRLSDKDGNLKIIAQTAKKITKDMLNEVLLRKK